MDRAADGSRLRGQPHQATGLGLGVSLGHQRVAPPLRSRKEPWEYDRELYPRRNEIERLFRRLKGFRRVFTRYDKLDVMFSGFILFALIYEALR